MFDSRFARRSSHSLLLTQGSTARLDCLSHQLPASLRQWSQAAARQIPQAFVVIAGVKKNHAFACGRVMKRSTRIFCDESKEFFPPGSTGVIKDLFAKFLEFFNVNYSYLFGDGFPLLVVDSVSVLEFFEWHRTPFFGGLQ